MSAVPAKHQVDLKIVTLGHYAVGKTSLVQRYLNETFDENVAAVSMSLGWVCLVCIVVVGGHRTCVEYQSLASVRITATHNHAQR